MTIDGARRTVLVLDDEATVCRSVVKILTRCGYRVDAERSPRDAIARLAGGHHVDLVLVDLMMPELPGMDFIRIAAERWPRLPIVVITGYATLASAVEATRLGAVNYLEKPFTPLELETTVAAAIARGTWKTAPAGGGTALAERSGAPALIDVDMPFDRDEVERATSASYVRHLTRSDVPILDFCHLGQRSCKRVLTKGTCQKGECPLVSAERRRAAQAAAPVAEDPIDVDLPFSAREVAAVTGDAYVRALGRGGHPVVGRWPDVSHTRRRVLAVDDEPVVVQAIRKSLGRKAYRVDEAFTGRSALARVATEPYDLLLLDLRMPDIHGLELLPRIREYQPRLPVVIVTGYASIDSAVDAIQKGAADYVPKPFTPDELRQTAERVLTLYRAA